jgi:hypothetical protein
MGVEFKDFFQARDFFYCASLALGLSTGLLLKYLFKARSWKKPGGLLTASLFCLSGAFFVVTIVTMLSNGAVFFDIALCYCAIVITTIGLISALFPRAVAFPVFLALGVIFVFTAFFFLRFPRYDGRVPFAAYSLTRGAKSIDLSPGEELVYELEVLRSGDLLPIIGGEERLRVYSLRLDYKTLVGLPPLKPCIFLREEYARLSPSKHRTAFSYQVFKGTLE